MKIKRQLFGVSFLAMAMMALFACSDDGSSEEQSNPKPEGEQSNPENGYKSCPDSNHPHMIDLGLPSGTLWACCNVGASKPEEYGGYYAWGETTTKSGYRPGTYQHAHVVAYEGWGDEISKKLYKLNDIGSDIAGTSYDAATANWGVPWRMPTLAQIQELLSKTTSKWTTLNGVNGRVFTGSNGGTVFLPAAGRRLGEYLSNEGSSGCYWSSSLLESSSDDAHSLRFSSGGAYWDFSPRDPRFVGYRVRPVRKN